MKLVGGLNLRKLASFPQSAYLQPHLDDLDKELQLSSNQPFISNYIKAGPADPCDRQGLFLYTGIVLYVVSAVDRWSVQFDDVTCITTVAQF